MSCVTSTEVIIKAPEESFGVSMDFTSVIGDTTVSILTSVLSVSPSGLTLSDDSIVDQTVEFRVSGGTEGQNYKIKVEITTSDSDTFVGVGTLKVRE